MCNDNITGKNLKNTEEKQRASDISVVAAL